MAQKITGCRNHLTAKELGFVNAERISAKAKENNTPMREAQPLISAANRLSSAFHPDSSVVGYEGHISTSPGRVDQDTLERIMEFGGFSVSDNPEYGSSAPDDITG